MANGTGNHDSGETSGSPKSGSGGKHSVREPIVVLSPAEQARVIRQGRDRK